LDLLGQIARSNNQNLLFEYTFIDYPGIDKPPYEIHQEYHKKTNRKEPPADRQKRGEIVNDRQND